MSTVSFQIPAISLDTIQGWISKSGLDRKLFYTTALELSMRTMETSFGYLDYLTPDAMAEAAKELGDDDLLSDESRSNEPFSVDMLAQYGNAANQSITPILLAQIISGAKTTHQELEMETITVDFSASRQDAVRTLADKSGFDEQNLYALAFVMGARTMSSTLSPFSFFSPGAVARQMNKSPKKPDRGNRSAK